MFTVTFPITQRIAIGQRRRLADLGGAT
jgi:hypothetical protein